MYSELEWSASSFYPLYSLPLDDVETEKNLSLTGT
jgi:hypothetical protein